MDKANAEPGSDTKNMKLVEIFVGLKKKWKLLSIYVLLGAIFGFSLATYKNKTPKYSSRLSFTMDESESKNSLGGLSSLASSIGIDAGGGGSTIFSGENFIELLKSRNLIEKTLFEPVNDTDLKNTSFIQLYVKAKKINETKEWTSNKNLTRVKMKPNLDKKLLTISHDSLLAIVHEDLINNGILNIKKKDNDLNILLIETKFQDENFSKYFSEKLLQIASEYYVERKTKKIRQSFDIIKKQTDSVREMLYADLAGLAASNDNVFGLNPARNVQRVPSARRQVNVQANTAILGELVKNQEMVRLTLLQETPLIQIIDKPKFPLIIEKTGKIKYALIFGFVFFLVGVLILQGRHYYKTTFKNSVNE